MVTKVVEANFDPSVTAAISGGPAISNVIHTDSNYDALANTILSTSGGYIKVTGTGFSNSPQLFISSNSSYTLATSISFINSTEIRSELPATSAGDYNVYVFNPNGTFAIKVNGVTFA
jgi:hypothetical protein